MTFTEVYSIKLLIPQFPVGQSHGGHGSSYGRQRRGFLNEHASCTIQKRDIKENGVLFFCIIYLK